MVAWRLLSDSKQIEEIRTLSNKTPCVIFKHSPDCSICELAKLRLEADWDFSELEVVPYIVDVSVHKKLAQAIADAFDNPHQSPQIMLIRDSICTYDAEGFDITVEELRECYEDSF